MAKNSDKAPKTKVDVEALNQALKIMDRGDLAELLYEDGGIKIQLKKRGAFSATASMPQFIQAQATQAAPAAVPAAAAAPGLEDNANTAIVKSPMVGTFYRAPSPDAPPVHKYRGPGRAGQNTLHNRGHENNERNKIRGKGQGKGNTCRERPGSRIQPAFDSHRKIGDKKCLKEYLLQTGEK